jgi:putative CocE/NonD family hydrolase
MLDTMSSGTCDAFCQAIEWAAEQPWSVGRVGLLGISYYAGTQWRAAAKRPRGLTCIIPWEGMSDYYRDRCRHGGILSDEFIRFWWNRQVDSNQYGRPGRSAASWGEDTIEGSLSPAELEEARQDQTKDNEEHFYRNEPYYASRDFRLEDIQVPLLSVANWGGISLHLRGNVQGYMHASSQFKYLRFIAGRHDLPFYYKEEVEIQQSFLDAWLKGEDRVGWTKPGAVAPVSILLRKGNVGYNNPEAEKLFKRREELEWPIARTEYQRFHLTPERKLSPTSSDLPSTSSIAYEANGSIKNQHLVQFWSDPFEQEVEITGHPLAHLSVSISAAKSSGIVPHDLDLFVTLRHFDSLNQEVLYTGTIGDPVPLTKGWLRCSLRKVHEHHPKHRDYLLNREYLSTDVAPLVCGEVYQVDVEIWPTNVVLEKGDRLVFEVSSGDTEGSGLFLHNSPVDRSKEKLAGFNHICFGPGTQNYIQLPVIPKNSC